MSADPSTLLQGIAAICVVAALAISLGAHAWKLSPAAAWRWSVANLLFALGSLLTVLREGSSQPWIFATADELELAGFAALLAGFRTFVRQPLRLGVVLLVLGSAAFLMAATYAGGERVWRLWVYCGVAAWLLGAAAWTAFSHLRSEFGLGGAGVVAAPMALACALQIVRAAAGLDADAAATSSLTPTPFNIAMMWAAFVIALALNFACAAFVGTRLVSRIRALTLTDPLTEALNRRAFNAVLERELGHQSRHGDPLAIVYFDLDHFKALNDIRGHAAGDAALRHVAALARGLCREHDTVARLGGEEFCVALPHTSLEGACLMAERLRSTIEDTPLPWAGEQIRLSASFGVARANLDERIDVQTLIARGDRAMYAAKRGGRNRVAA